MQTVQKTLLGVDVPVINSDKFPQFRGSNPRAPDTVPKIQFIDSGWLFLLCGQRRVLTVQTVQPIVEIPMVPLLDWFLTCPLCNVVHSSRVKVVDTSVVAQMQIPLFLLIIEILQLQYIDKVIDVGFAGPAVFGAIVEELSMDTVVAMLVVVQRQLPWFRGQKTAQVPQFQYFFVVDVPVVQVDIWVRSVFGQGR